MLHQLYYYLLSVRLFLIGISGSVRLKSHCGHCAPTRVQFGFSFFLQFAVNANSKRINDAKYSTFPAQNISLTISLDPPAASYHRLMQMHRQHPTPHMHMIHLHATSIVEFIIIITVNQIRSVHIVIFIIRR